MPTFTLRNQDKIKAKLGKKELNKMILSLKFYFANNFSENDIYTSSPYHVLYIRNIVIDRGIIAFWVVGVTNGEYRLAFKKFIE